MKVAIIHEGRFGNKVFQYLVAKQLAELLGESQVAGCHIPELGIRSPAPMGLGRTLMCSGNRLAMEDVLHAVSRSRFDSVIVSGNVLQYRCLPAVDTARRWLGLESVSEEAETAPMDHVVVHVRSGDIVFGAHRDYPPIPPTFYERVIVEAGMPPIFVTEPGDNYYIEHLKRQWPRARFVSNSDPMADFRFLMSARHLAVASSTFGWLAGWLGRAEIVHLPLIGITNPSQRPDVDLIPIGDCRYRYWLFPEFRFHAKPSEILTLLSGKLVPTQVNDPSKLRGIERRIGRSEFQRLSDGDRWIRQREARTREPILKPGPVGHLLRSMSQRLAGRRGQLAFWLVHATGFTLWARLALPEDLAASAAVGIGFVCATTVTHLGFPRLTMTRPSLTQAQASAMYWVIVFVAGVTGLIGIGWVALSSSTHDWPAGLVFMASVAIVIDGLCAEPSATVSRIDGGATRSASWIIGTGAAWATATWLASRQLMAASIACVAVGPAVASGAICLVAGGWVPSRPERSAGVKPLLREGSPDWVAELSRLAVWAGIAATAWVIHGPEGLAEYAVALCALAALLVPRFRIRAPSQSMTTLPATIALTLAAVVVVTAPTAVEALLAETWAGVGASLRVIIPWYFLACIVAWEPRPEPPVQRQGDSPAGNTVPCVTLTAAAGIAIACASAMGMAIMLHVTGAVMVMLMIWPENKQSVRSAWSRAKSAASSLTWPAVSAIAGGLAGSLMIHALEAMPAPPKVSAAAATTLIVSIVCARLRAGLRQARG
jgi:hypothetical protein